MKKTENESELSGKMEKEDKSNYKILVITFYWYK